MDGQDESENDQNERDNPTSPENISPAVRLGYRGVEDDSKENTHGPTLMSEPHH